MIPQLKELAGEYGVDGAWVDGDCWVAALDYSAGALGAFREETGIESVLVADEEYYDEFREFNARGIPAVRPPLRRRNR